MAMPTVCDVMGSPVPMPLCPPADTRKRERPTIKSDYSQPAQSC